MHFLWNFSLLPLTVKKLYREWSLCYRTCSIQQKASAPDWKTGLKKQEQVITKDCFNDSKDFKRGDSDFLVTKDGLAALRWMDSRVAMLLSNFRDPSKLSTVKRREKGQSERSRVLCQPSSKNTIPVQMV